MRTAAVVLTVFAAMSCLSVYSSASPSATAEEANSSDEEYCSNRPPGTGSGRALNAFPVADAGDAIVIGVFVRRDVGNGAGSWAQVTVAVVGVIVAAAGRLRVIWFPYFVLSCCRRLRPDDVLVNFARGEIYGYVRLNPGESYSDIKRSLGLAAGPLTYHLAVLEREGLVRSVPNRARRLFYSSDAPVPENGGDLRALQGRMLGILKADPGIAVSGLAAVLGVSRHVALYHIRKLVRADLVRLERRMARLRAYPVARTPLRDGAKRIPE